MTLERWLSLFVLAFCLTYGYAAWFVLDAAMPPFARFSPVWPSSFPKVLAILGLILAILQLFHAPQPLAEIRRSKLATYRWLEVGLTLIAMVLYALLLAPLGFILSTVLFLIGVAALLGERRWLLLVSVALLSAGGIWYLVDPVLGIYMRPWPALSGGH
ncbi:tripartite tricarboxylate transporter TctB family protein [Hahella sp. SMD15-11]|uniref:Tripartite tricarboxylate transporter TctB family protein n=1 Tax=Thermohahella caldifontis TaxID=3142973 RepID=A0AB39USR7_9GAMM